MRIHRQNFFGQSAKTGADLHHGVVRPGADGADNPFDDARVVKEVLSKTLTGLMAPFLAHEND